MPCMNSKLFFYHSKKPYYRAVFDQLHSTNYLNWPLRVRVNRRAFGKEIKVALVMFQAQGLRVIAENKVKFYLSQFQGA